MLSRAFVRSKTIPGSTLPRTYPVSSKLFCSGLRRRRLTSSSLVDRKKNTSDSLNNAKIFSSSLSIRHKNVETNPENKITYVYTYKAFPAASVSAHWALKRPMLNSVNNRISLWEDRANFSSQPENSENKASNNNSSGLPRSVSDKAETHAKDQNLPDLTKGIPSTFNYEADRRSFDLPLNLTKSAESYADGPERGRGSLPESAYVTSSEKKRLQVANYLYGIFFLLSIVGTVYLGRNWETDVEEKAHPQTSPGWSVGRIWKRARARINDKLNYYQEPAFRKLLPDIEPMFERPYTLVLGLEDLLICSEWSREHGWRLAKRPGVDYFLRYLSQYYELVLFTTQPSHLAEPIIRKLDPYHIIMWPLFREATLYENGQYIKDLSYLNRDLSKVIVLDTNNAHVKKQPENSILLDPWHGDPKDKELISLIPFLEYIHTMAYGDVRKALKSFEGHHIPTEFARREAISRKKFLDQLEKEKQKSPKHSGVALLSNALGIKHQSMMMDPNDQSPGEAFAQGKMLQDQARERGQRNYELLEKEIRENGEKWLKEEAALEEKSKEESMKAMKSGLIGWLGGEQVDKS